MQTKSSHSLQHIVGPQGQHYKAHGDAPLVLGGHVSVYTCSVKGSGECSVGLSVDRGGVSVLVKLNAAGARTLLALLTDGAETAGAVDAELERIRASSEEVRARGAR